MTLLTIVFQMVGCKQWYLGLAAIVVVVAVFGALVGVACWHMAYQEASLEAAGREQRTLDYARRSCRTCKSFGGFVMVFALCKLVLYSLNRASLDSA